MPYLGDRSTRRLFTCDPRLQLICRDVISWFDFAVLCGHRGREAQTDAYDAGASTVQWPHSRHNRLPSLAVDLAPFPIDWDDLERFRELSRLMKLAAAIRGIELTWGGDWSRLVDMPHYQVPAEVVIMPAVYTSPEAFTVPV